LKRNGSLRDVGFYLLIAVVLLMTIFALRGGMGNQEKVTYAQVRQLLEQQPFDVLAIDESLMSSSGVDLCMAIRGRYPGMTRIVMTNAPTREIVDARSHGVIDGYVVKPVSASTLLAQIRNSRKE
jgi:DNA-binding NtrC family response regulator